MKTLLSIAILIMISVSLSCNKPEDTVPDVPFVVEPSGTLYIGFNNPFNNYYMYAIDAATGAVKWKVLIPGGVTSTPTIAKGKLYFKNGFNLCSIDTANPTTYKLEFHTNTQHKNAPLFYNDVIYHKDGGKDYGFNINTNTNVMSVFTTGGDNYASSTAANGILISSKSGIYAINLANSTVMWLKNIGANGYSSPAISNGVVYVGGLQPEFYALDMMTGTEKWKFKLNNELNSYINVASSPTIYNGMVYFGGTDSAFYALNAATGALVWKKKITNAQIHSDPIVVNNTVFFNCLDFFALNATTGELKWKTVLPHIAFYESPVYANGVVYIGHSVGKLTALDANTGSVLWHKDYGGWMSDAANPIVVDKNGVVHHPGNSGEQN
jgi:outer membrane protein assembly factor BamB